MEMKIQNAKIELIQWLTTLEDHSIIEKVMDLMKSDTKDWYHSISDAEKKSLESGLTDAKNGKLKPNSEAEKVYGKWL